MDLVYESDLLKFKFNAIAPAGSMANHASMPSVGGQPPCCPPGGGTTGPPYPNCESPVCEPDVRFVGLSPGMAPAVTHAPLPVSIPTFCLRNASTKSFIRIHSKPMGMGFGSFPILSYTTISTSFAFSTGISNSSFQRSVRDGCDLANWFPSTLIDTKVSTI